MSTSTVTETIINGSFEFPPRGWDCMRKLYITLVLWIFIACVGAHAHLRNHFRSGGLSILMLITFLSLFISKLSINTVCRDKTLRVLGGDHNCRQRKAEFVIFPENEASAIFWGIAAFFSFGVSMVGPIIEEAQLNLHGRSVRRLVITTLYNINLFLCLSACAMFQPLENFMVPVIVTIILVELLVIIFGGPILFPNLNWQQQQDRIFGFVIAIYWHGCLIIVTGAFIDESLEVWRSGIRTTF